MPEILAPRNAPGLGAVDFGAVAIQFLRNAYRGTGFYAKEKPRTNLRLIANIQDPSYVSSLPGPSWALPTLRRYGKSVGPSAYCWLDSAVTLRASWLTMASRKK